MATSAEATFSFYQILFPKNRLQQLKHYLSEKSILKIIAIDYLPMELRRQKQENYKNIQAMNPLLKGKIIYR
ncbi:MAG: hypothetical protein AAF572_10010 [Cyanobacteria bacterium P01_B01_bin.77]